MKTVIHVNQHIIRLNRALPVDYRQPPLTVKDYKQNRRASRAKIMHNGEVVAEVVYSPHKPLSCGAVCWIETHERVEVE